MKENHDKAVHMLKPIPGPLLRKGPESLREYILQRLRELSPEQEAEEEARMNNMAEHNGMVPNMIFVFGSNDAGIHGAGAAHEAYTERSFPWGIGEGLANNCYALPTKNSGLKSHSLAVVRRNVQNFLHFATEIYDLENSFSSDPKVAEGGHTKFQITRIGCGFAGFQDAEIAPMFLYAPPNCWFDTKWKRDLGGEHNYWGTY